VVCLKKSVTKSALYVACSRATTLSGLFFDGDFTPPIKPQHDAVELELTRLLSMELTLDADEHLVVSHLLSPGDYGKRVKVGAKVSQKQENDIWDHRAEHEKNPSLRTPIETGQSTNQSVKKRCYGISS
jgi:hypothetical protein